MPCRGYSMRAPANSVAPSSATGIGAPSMKTASMRGRTARCFRTAGLWRTNERPLTVARHAAGRGDPQPPLPVDLQIANEAGRHVVGDVLEACGRREPDQATGVEADPDVAVAILRERRRRGTDESLLRSE